MKSAEIRKLAFTAIEREMMSDDMLKSESGTEAFHRYMDGEMEQKEVEKWAFEERHYRSFDE